MLVKSQNRLVFVLCILAALRVGFYAAAFPFFNNVDEEAHFDQVMKYSKAHVPDSIELFLPISADYISKYGSPEFFFKATDYPENRIPQPLWEVSKEDSLKRFSEKASYWRIIPNHESTHAPLYYTIAGLWVKIGEIIGIKTLKAIFFLYWIRLLNVILIIFLVLISSKAVQILFPEDKFMFCCVPLLIAMMPQDSYYSIQSDVLSPCCFGLAFLAALKFTKSYTPTLNQGIWLGLTSSLTVLVKTSNLPLLLVIFITVAIKTRFAIKNKNLNDYKKSILAFCLCALLPISIWFIFNYISFGDLTGSDKKIELLGWSKKNISEWHMSKLFSWDGLYEFWTELMASFWRGEFAWSRMRLSNRSADYFYWTSSLIFILASIINYPKIKGISKQKLGGITLWSFLSVFFFMIILSLAFDFNEGYYPSREHPYFTSGRLMTGALIPFIFLYLHGFNKLFSWVANENIRITIVIFVVIFITWSEFKVNSIAFNSHYNLFFCPW